MVGRRIPAVALPPRWSLQGGSTLITAENGVAVAAKAWLQLGDWQAAVGMILRL